jgi:hypothetical protein
LLDEYGLNEPRRSEGSEGRRRRRRRRREEEKKRRIGNLPRGRKGSKNLKSKI